MEFSVVNGSCLSDGLLLLVPYWAGAEMERFLQEIGGVSLFYTHGIHGAICRGDPENHVTPVLWSEVHSYGTMV